MDGRSGLLDLPRSAKEPSLAPMRPDFMWRIPDECVDPTQNILCVFDVGKLSEGEVFHAVSRYDRLRHAGLLAKNLTKSSVGAWPTQQRWTLQLVRRLRKGPPGRSAMGWLPSSPNDQ